eukprot:TRINITY_DN4395_c0_g1_i1.p1 TRINITY_DN4395_c0_g1~~TRINITY_DN4395_c0_g1_i1.p1  ORF type:complete len:389 (-),score=70.66 TRINITY_DN4395_c0_g1_i1:58-1224(-)
MKEGDEDNDAERQQPQGTVITTMSLEEAMEFAVGLARVEGWLLGENDMFAYYAADPDGFFLMRDKTTNEALGCVSCVVHRDAFSANDDDTQQKKSKIGYVGYYIASPHHRGKGYGIALWNHGMRRLANERCEVVGLDGVTAQQPRYKKSGFQVVHSNNRYISEVPQLLSNAVNYLKSVDEKYSLVPLITPEGVNEPLLRALLLYDGEVFYSSMIPSYQSEKDRWPRSRSLIRHFLTHLKSKARCFVAVRGDVPCREGYEVVGYGAIRRKFNKTHERGITSLAPLFADSQTIAVGLISALLDSAIQVSLWDDDSDEVRKVMVDTPVVNSKAIELFENVLQMKLHESSSARMIKLEHNSLNANNNAYSPSDEILHTNLDRVYGLTCLELG